MGASIRQMADGMVLDDDRLTAETFTTSPNLGPNPHNLAMTRLQLKRIWFRLN